MAITELLGDRPVRLSDIEQLLTAVSTEDFYVKAEEYRRLIGLGKTQFAHLKRLGKFDRGSQKATLGSRRIRIHKYFNMHSQKIEWFGIEKITPNKRGKYKKAKQQEASKNLTKV